MNRKYVFNVVAFSAATTVLMTSAPVKAALLFQDSDSFSDALTELNAAPALSVSKYDGTGIVDEIKLTFSGALRTSGELVNTASQAQDFTFTLLASKYDLEPIAGSPAALNTFSWLTLDPVFGQQLIGSETYTALVPGTPTDFGPFSISGSDSQSITDVTAIADFLGSGVITLQPFTEISTLTQGGGGNVDTFVDTFADGTFTIEYHGEELPLPPVSTPEPPVSTPEPIALPGLLAAAAVAGKEKLKAKLKALFA